MEGTPIECRQAADAVGTVLRVVSVSDPYPNRGESQVVRVYLDVRLEAPEKPPGTV
jgi:hypothetical protein